MLPAALLTELLLPIVLGYTADKFMRGPNGRPTKTGRGLLGLSLVPGLLSTVESGISSMEGMGYDPVGRRAKMARGLESAALPSFLDDLGAGLDEGQARNYGTMADDIFRGEISRRGDPTSAGVVDQVLLDRITQGREMDLHRASLTSMPSLQEIAAQAGLTL